MSFFGNLSKKQKPVAPPGVVGNNSMGQRPMRQQPRPTLFVGGPAYFTPEGYEAPRQPEQAFMPTDRMPDPIGEQFRRERPTLPPMPPAIPPMPPAITGTDLGLPMNPGIPAPGGVEMGQPFQLPADNTPIGDIPPSFLDFYSQQGMDNVDIPTLPENDYFGDIGQMDFEREYGLKDFEPLLPPPPPTYTTPVVEGEADIKVPTPPIPTLPIATPESVRPDFNQDLNIPDFSNYTLPTLPTLPTTPVAAQVQAPIAAPQIEQIEQLQQRVAPQVATSPAITPPVETPPAPVERRAPLPFDLEPQIRDETDQVERPLQERAPIAPISEPRMPDPLTSVAAPVVSPPTGYDDGNNALTGDFNPYERVTGATNPVYTPPPALVAPPQLEQIEQIEQIEKVIPQLPPEQLQQVIPQLPPEVIQEVIPQLPPEVIQQVLPQLPPEVIENLTMFTPQVSFPSPMMPRQTPNFNTRRMNPRFTR